MTDSVTGSIFCCVERHFGIRPLSSIMEQYVGKQCWITVIKKADSTLACYLCTLDFS